MLRVLIVLFLSFWASSQVVLHTKSYTKNPMLPEGNESKSYMIVDNDYILDNDDSSINYFDVAKNKLYTMIYEDGKFRIGEEQGQMPPMGEMEIKDAGSVEYNGYTCRKIIVSTKNNPQFSLNFELYLAKINELDDYKSYQKYIKTAIEKLQIKIDVKKNEYPVFFHMKMGMQGNIMMEIKEELIKIDKKIPDNGLLQEIRNAVHGK